jgi:hypothetical protein
VWRTSPQARPIVNMSPNAMATTKKAAKTKADSKGAPAAGAKGEKGEKAEKGAEKDAGKRKLGLRGAAPWAARHAAKHAAEARARAAEPPLPGSARATIRTPTGADDIKQKIGDLHNSVVQIKGLRKNLNKGFFEIGRVLGEIQARRLYEAKGFGTFEAFLEREIDLGKTTSLRLVKTAHIFQKEAALEYGMDRVFNAIVALETPPEEFLSGKLPPTPLSAPSLPMKPPGR